ncbi:hypothetical protein LTR36_010900 [Oleoguttula mirabilis]|uniref:Uncharacterized protein n=1 Tax=Oleoguttula mirabilis TaxID=1507867 RepID=A0AAV9J442_9PEZI|nr:hypothetical protein LTR36_010900 [Oleoguttula mirabilis]
MSHGLGKMLLILVPLLVAFASGRSIYERSSSPHLQVRDNTGDTPLPACIPRCGPKCIGPYSSYSPPSLAASERRSLATLDIRDFGIVFAGDAERLSPNPQYVAKRNLYKVTPKNVDSFIKNKVSTETKSTRQLMWCPENDATSTTVQTTFDDSNKVEIGTGGLTGCTVLTVVSRRGVFMAHFFESLAFDRPSDEELIDAGEDPATYPALDYNGQVRNLVDRTQGDTEGLGPALDVSIFNQDDDNTHAFIMTPRQWGDGVAGGILQFTGSINTLRSQVMGLLPALSDVTIYDYVRLNMEDPAQEDELYTNARGSAFFQYDPKNYKQKGWRVFYERALQGEDGWSS